MRRVPLALVLVYLATRLYHLGLLPMVSDEGTYLTWGVRAWHASGVDDWLASLEDGKQPLLAWLMPPFLAAVPDRLIAGRLVSVATGLANLWLLAYLGRRLYDKATGWAAAALYLAAPIALIHDRMALYDSLVATTSLLVLWGAIAWSERPDARRTLALGLAMGAALLTKLSAFFFVALVPLAVLLWDAPTLRRWWPLGQAFFLAAAVYSVLYLSPIVNNLQDGNFLRYSLTAGEVLGFPVGIWAKNALFIGEAAVTYLGWPLAIIAAATIGFGLARGGRREKLLALWTLLPMLAFILTAKIIYSRYVVFCFVTVLLPSAQLLVTLARIRVRIPSVDLPWSRAPWAIAWAAGAATVLPGLLFGARLLSDPASAPWMNDRRFITDRFQYVESNYAGYGLAEIVEQLRARAAQKPIVVLARSTTGMPRDGVTAYLLDWPNVQVGFVPENESIVGRLQRQPDRVYQLAAQGADLFYVLSDAPNGEQERRFRTLNPGLEPVLEIAKPGNHSRFQLYQTRWLGDVEDTWLEPPVKLGSQIALRGFRLSKASIAPGESVRLVLYWAAESRPNRDYTVFNHIADAGGRIVAQKDGQPAQGQLPTSRWHAGETVADMYDLTVPPDAPAGTFDLLTGMYELQTMRRLPVYREGAPATDHVMVARLTVMPVVPAPTVALVCACDRPAQP